MKPTFLFLLSLLLSTGLGAFNDVRGHEDRCKKITQPFSEDESFEKRISDDLIHGIWKQTDGNYVTLYQFHKSGLTGVLTDREGSLQYQQLAWSVMQIGAVVYLRLDGGSVDNDHLYVIKQNCQGVILKHAHSSENLFLDYEGKMDLSTLFPRINDLQGHWFASNNPNSMQIRLYDNQQYDLIYNNQIESGSWELFPDGNYLVLNREEENDFKVIKIKHVDFMSMDVTFDRSIDPADNIFTLEKKQLF